MTQWKTNPRLRAVVERVRGMAVYMEATLRRAYAAAWRRLNPPVTVHRRKGVLTIVDAPSIGGAVHSLCVLSYRTLTVKRSEAELQVMSGTMPVLGVIYRDEATAQAAQRAVRAALTPASFGTWAKRGAIALALVVMFNALGAALWGRPETVAAGAPATAQGMAAALADPGFVPPEPAPQVLPGGTPDVGLALAQAQQQLAPMLPGVDLANLQDTPETRKALAEAEARLQTSMPPVAGADAMPGLADFGLNNGPGDGGPGCDPKMAYSVAP